MNQKKKRRVIAVLGIIAVLLVLVLAVVSGGSAARTMTVSMIASGVDEGQKVQVSGNVVPGTPATEGNALVFEIYDPEGSSDQTVRVRYEGAASSTFGNDVTAICTGRVNAEGVLECTELVTKCPSKYENATSALGVGKLLGYGQTMVGTVVKVTGVVQEGSLGPAGHDPRMAVADSASGQKAGEAPLTLDVLYEGALSDQVAEGSEVVLTGALTQDGAFEATEVALAE